MGLTPILKWMWTMFKVGVRVRPISTWKLTKKGAVSRRTTPIISRRTRRTELVSIMERKAITFTNITFKEQENDEECNAIETNVIKDIVVVVSGIHIDMIIEVHMVVIANPFYWWFN